MGRNTAMMVVVYVAVLLAVTVDVGWCWSEESYAETATNKANEAQQWAKESVQDAKDNADSWAEWAMAKVSGTLGLGKNDAKQTARDVINKAEDAASKSTETIQSAASGSSKYASEKATNAANLAAEKFEQAKDIASDKANQAMHKASNLAGDTKETIAETMTHGCGDAYNYAAAKAGEAGEWGSDGVERVVGGVYGDNTYESMKEQAKEGYEVGKEKASDAAGEVGEMMRDKVAEF